jgi:hypothetical protein
VFLPILNFCQNKFGALFALFANFEVEIEQNGAKNDETFVYKLVLELNFAVCTHQLPGEPRF